MNKLIRLGFGFVFFSLLICCNKKENSVNEAEKKTNIIFILADDLGYGDLSCYGQTKFQTPNIDRLAKGGMRFTQHYSGSTVCAPSRSALLTGQHTGHTEIRGNSMIKPEGQQPLDSGIVTFAKILQQGGYTTGAFGKWGLGYPGSEGDPTNQGFDEFYGYNCQRQAHRYYPKHLWHNKEKVILTGNDFTNKVQYAPEVIHKKALNFLEVNKDQPFFMFYPSNIPHAELIIPENEEWEQFKDKFYETPYVNDRPGADYGDPDFDVMPYASQSKPRAAFAAMVTLLDKQVGEILDKVQELGIENNTIIIFSSDNGPHLEGGADPDFFNSNGPLRGYKRDLYEGGIRVPMIAYWPGKIKSGATSDHISAFWDYLPTFCDIAELEQPTKNLDGISFLPELLGKEQQKHKQLYWEFGPQGGKQSVRVGNWKGIRLNMDNNKDAPIALYKLETDLGEENDVAAEYPEIVARIDDIMKEEHTYSERFPFAFEEADKPSE